MLTFLEVGFGGNLVQGFRVYAWRAVPSFPQIALCFPSFALWPQPLDHNGTLPCLLFLAVVSKKKHFGPPLGHLISTFVVKNGVIATATSPTPRPGGLSHRPKKLAFPSYLMNIFQITEFSNLSVSESWLFVRMGSTVMVSKMQQLDNMASQVHNQMMIL